METKNIFIVGGSSGIGLEIVRILDRKGPTICLSVPEPGGQLEVFEKVRHLKMDVTADSLPLEELPGVLDGMVYCPGTIELRPFQRLTMDRFKRI